MNQGTTSARTASYELIPGLLVVLHGWPRQRPLPAQLARAPLAQGALARATLSITIQPALTPLVPTFPAGDDWLCTTAGLWRGDADGRALLHLPIREWAQPPAADAVAGASGVTLTLECTVQGLDKALDCGALHLCALAAGYVPGHGTAWRAADGRAMVLAGLAHSGKTGALLAAVAQGACYIADDIVLLDSATGLAFGLGNPISVSSGHLKHLPAYTTRIDALQIRKLNRQQRLRRFLGACLPLAGRLLPRSLAQRLQVTATARSTTAVAVEDLFEADRRTRAAPAKTLVTLIQSAAADAALRAADGPDSVQRWLLALRHDLKPLLSAYERFRYAFPEARCALLDTLDADCQRLLAPLLADMDCYTLNHPANPPPDALLTAVAQSRYPHV